MKRHYIHLAFALVYSSLTAQPVAFQACAHQWCGGNGIDETAFLVEFATDAQSPFSNVNMLLSSDNGCVAFGLPSTTNTNALVRITPTKDANPLTGFTTFDLSLNLERIQRHLDGTEPFTEIWQFLAADCNLDGAITPADKITLQGWQLGLETPANTWRFVPASFQFINPAQPLVPSPPGFLVKTVGTLNSTEIFRAVQLGRVISGTTCAVTGTSSIPDFSVSEAWPNPTDAGFSIQLNLNTASELLGEVFDAGGRRIVRQRVHNFEAGEHLYNFESPGASGFYYWKITDESGRYRMGKVVRGER